MQTYKISTLGESFIVINRSIIGAEDALTEGCASHDRKSHVLEVVPDMRYDYRVRTLSAKAFAPDIMRALLVFLYGVKGLPRSEYEIMLDGMGVVQVYFSEGYGGNVGKCKLLFSKRAENSEKCDVIFYCVEAPQGNYVFLICDNTEVVDMKKITSRAIAECGGASPMVGLCALSYASGEAALRFHPLDNAHTAAASAYAAAAYLLGELTGARAFIIKNGELGARCCVDDCAVRVYDLFPAVHKIP